ncbi:amidohydrolase family protein [Agrobacterium vitis]
MIIDAHQHFWLMKNRQGQWPPPELAAIYRDFGTVDLEPQLSATGVGGTVLVQSLPSIDDTRFLLDLAQHHDFILGVVGWVDLKAADAATVITKLATYPKLKGLRPMVQDIAEDDWIDDPALDPAIGAMLASGLTFDALVLPRHLAPLERFARRHPALPVVVDHGAKPIIAQGLYSDWHKAMTRLADLENVSCKLSGLLTEAGSQQPEAIRPYAETILELFGPDRVMWGSDWPVLNLVSDYQSWFAQARAIVPEAAYDRVFCENARRFYGL